MRIIIILNGNRYESIGPPAFYMVGCVCVYLNCISLSIWVQVIGTLSHDVLLVKTSIKLKENHSWLDMMSLLWEWKKKKNIYLNHILREYAYY